MSYKILDYSYKQARKLNVEIKPSKRKGKKVDVYKNDKYILSIGDKNYSDYPHYVISNGIEYANKRKELYKKRHKNDLSKKNSAGYYSYNLLW